MEQLEIDISLTETTRREGGSARQYPHISDRKRSRFQWTLSGTFCLYVDGERFLVTSWSPDGCISDFIAVYLTMLHGECERLWAGETISQEFVDNAGTLRLAPDGDALELTFTSIDDDRNVIERMATVSRRAFTEELVTASESLMDEMLELNPNLADSDAVSELRDAIEETRALLDD